MNAELRLDLTNSKVKAANARKHLESLERECESVFTARKPYGIRWGEVDSRTGWISLFLVPHKPIEFGLGAYVGDVMHNLRSALDYIAVALAKASGAPIRKQQFPIYDDCDRYKRDLGTPSAPKMNSRFLYGVKCGLDEIERVQPYHGGENAHSDPLWHVERFSNADKHREIALDVSRLIDIKLPKRVKGRVIQAWTNPEILSWLPEQEFELRRYRFAKPFPPQFEIEAIITIAPRFGVSAYGTEPKGHAIGLETLSECCDHVSTIIDQFEAL